MMYLDNIFNVAVQAKVSDIFVKVGLPVRFRYLGAMVTLKNGRIITESMVDDWVAASLPAYLKSSYEDKGDVDFGFQDEVGTRFRVNIFRQNGMQGFVARVLESQIRSIDELMLPKVLHDVPKYKGGLVFVTGATGSGKSTTLAAILQTMNHHYPYHIITLEDPIEYLYRDDKSLINQREVGLDTLSFQQGLKGALRQNPDVIMIGELRDQETARNALRASETGILVITTLHTHSSVDSLSRFVSFFPVAEHPMIADFLGRNLRMCISQRLIPAVDQRTQVVATEVMVVNQRIKEVIQKFDDIDKIHEIIKESKDYYSMHSFDQSLIQLCRSGKITEKSALRYASSPMDLAVAISGVGT